MASNRDEPPNPLLPRTGSDPERTRKVVLRRQGADRKIVVPTLRVVAGRDMLRFVTVHDEDEITIGRDENGSLVLSDASVSRRHAVITSDDEGGIQIEDLGSTNGTAVNGQPIDRSPLRPGDHVEIGAVSLRLELLSLEEVAHLEGVLTRLEAKNRDPLTGLLSRAWLDDELPTLLRAAGRDGQDCAFLFVDLDHFKSINDRFGHLIGDDALVGVSRLLLVGVRDTDACVRYGGEELLLFLQGSTEAAAFDVAERVRRSIEVHDWSRTNPALKVTASIGVAGWRPGESVKEWINRADQALYAAKAQGRNRAVRAAEMGR